MGRHEIRLRRKMMTSRRIESHKNYSALLKQHARASLARRVLRLILYIIVFLGLALMVYTFMHTVDKKKTDSDTTKTYKSEILWKHVKIPKKT